MMKLLLQKDKSVGQKLERDKFRMIKVKCEVK